MAANTELFLPLCFAQCFTVRDKSRDFAELLAEVVQADMGIVLGDVLIGVAHHALDGQLIGAGLMQAAREGMAAPVGRGSDGADLLHEGSEADAEHLGGDGVTGRIADNPLPVLCQAGGEVGFDFGVDWDEPVPACGGFHSALEVVSIGVIGKSGEGQKLRDPESGIAQDQDGVRPGIAGSGQLFQLLEVEIGQDPFLVLGLDRGQANELGIVLDDDVTLHSKPEERGDQALVILDAGLGEPVDLILVNDLLQIVDGDAPDLFARQSGDSTPGGPVGGDGGGTQPGIFPAAPEVIDLLEGVVNALGGRGGVGTTPLVQRGLGVAGLGVVG